MPPFDHCLSRLLCRCAALALLSSFFAQGFILPSPSHHRSLNAALGDLAAPNAPLLDTALIDAARANLSWEKSYDDAVAWESGELWGQTRLRLVELWVLPRDMSNGADERYAKAAERGETKILNAVPQLLRLPSSDVIASAKAVLSAPLPPALLRSEPALLSYPRCHIEGGLGKLMTTMSSKEAAIVACRDTPGLLLGAVEGWIQEQA